MISLTSYIIEKFKITKNINININNADNICDSLKSFFKNNRAFTKHEKEIFEFIEDKFNNYSSFSVGYEEENKYIICSDNFYKEYADKFNLNKDLITFIDSDKSEEILNWCTNKKRSNYFEKKYDEGKIYFYIYCNDDYIWIDSGLNGFDNPNSDYFSIAIIPEFEFEN